MENKKTKFNDARCESGLQDLLNTFKCLNKLVEGKTDTLTDKEMIALHDVADLSFDNYHGEVIPAIRHLTTFGRREVFKNYSKEIINKSEHIIIKMLYY